MKELKPCPFCGGKAHIRKFKRKAKNDKGEVMKGDYKTWYGLGCYTPDCICYMNVDERTTRFMFIIRDEEAKKLTIERWNRRVEE